MLTIKLLPIMAVISLQLSACQLISCSTNIYCKGSELDPSVTRHYAVVNKSLFNRY